MIFIIETLISLSFSSKTPENVLRTLFCDKCDRYLKMSFRKKKITNIFKFHIPQPKRY